MDTKVEVLLIGYVANEPQMRYTPSEIAVTSLSVRTYKSMPKVDQNGQPTQCPDGWSEYKERWTQTTYNNVTVWRGRAEAVNQYISKGDKVCMMVEPTGDTEGGFQNPRVWAGDDGIAKARFEYTLKDFVFFQKREANGGLGSPQQMPPAGDSFEDGLPF